MLNFKLAIILSISVVHAIEIAPRLTNGDTAIITEFPFLVSIQQINVHICGGSLLSEKWIVSSTRCYLSRSIAELSIEYGSTEITPGLNVSNKPRISQIIFHESYGEPTPLANDISLIESDSPIVTGFHRPFARLTIPGASQFNSGTKSVHAGWGHVQQNVRTNVLQKANVNILSFDECVEAVGDTEMPSRNNICAIGDSAMCAGDSGGPLLVNGILVGISSFRNGPVCNNVEGRYPNVYTDVSQYTSWIERHTGIDFQLNMFLQRKA